MLEAFQRNMATSILWISDLIISWKQKAKFSRANNVGQSSWLEERLWILLRGQSHCRALSKAVLSFYKTKNGSTFAIDFQRIDAHVQHKWQIVWNDEDNLRVFARSLSFLFCLIMEFSKEDICSHNYAFSWKLNFFEFQISITKQKRNQLLSRNNLQSLNYNWSFLLAFWMCH